jgi:hypothetical protein
MEVHIDIVSDNEKDTASDKESCTARIIVLKRIRGS